MMRYSGWIGVLAVAWWLGVSGAAAQDEAAPKRDAQQKVEALVRDIRDGLQRRDIEDAFARYEAYSGDRLDASAGDRTFSDKTGNGRLDWFDYLLRHPVESIAAAEAFTWTLNEQAKDDAVGVRQLIATASEKLDAGELSSVQRRSQAWQPQQSLQAVEQAVVDARQSLLRAYEPLDASDRAVLERLLYEQSTGKIAVGYRFADLKLGRRVVDLLEKIDRQALLMAADELGKLTDETLLSALATLPEAQTLNVAGVKGDVVMELATRAGRILVGGRGDNRYDLQALADVCAVIDLGGDDIYIEGTVGFGRPVLAVIDLGGDDRFAGKLPGIQGGAVLGASLLVSTSGDDTFEAVDIAQGSALGGVGILVNGRGNDQYTARCRVQGQAVGGFGLLLDRGGEDRYRAALLSQGVGGPIGFGVLADRDGEDHYYAGGLYSGGYNDTPGYGGWSQGVGVGPRGSANGGIGVLLDGGGDDVYEYDYFSHGGGYWFAAGFARDFGGNDQRIGSTRTKFDGSPREVKPFVRWGLGYGCHYALGFLIDDSGDDTYVGTTASVAFSWDVAVGALLDLDGNDHYKASSAANAANAGLAVLLDSTGDDRYQARRLGYANPKVNYHPIEKAGGNFSMLLDRGGEDDFGEIASNGQEAVHGWEGGFFLSEPVTADADQAD